MRDIDYQFEIPALDYTKDHLNFHAAKATNPYDFWFNKSNSCSSNLIKPTKLEFLNLPINNSSIKQIRSSEKLQFSDDKAYTCHAFTQTQHNFVTHKFYLLYSTSTHSRRNYDPFRKYFIK